MPQDRMVPLEEAPRLVESVERAKRIEKGVLCDVAVLFPIAKKGELVCDRLASIGPDDGTEAVPLAGLASTDCVALVQLTRA